MRKLKIWGLHANRRCWFVNEVGTAATAAAAAVASAAYLGRRIRDSQNLFAGAKRAKKGKAAKLHLTATACRNRDILNPRGFMCPCYYPARCLLPAPRRSPLLASASASPIRSTKELVTPAPGIKR